ncbi:MAG TPA: PhzF family phenazine biosynthesis protein [Chloroflexota bacterium]
MRRDGQAWHHRWLTPTAELDLCGPGTLASARALGGRASSARHAGVSPRA